MASLQCRLEFCSHLTQIFSPVPGQRVSKGDLPADGFCNDPGFFCGKLGLNKNNPDAMFSGIFDQTSKLRRLGAFPFDFNRNLRKSVSLCEISIRRMKDHELKPLPFFRK